MSIDPTCAVCHEPRSAHVATSAGPLTHPREARGEGRYVFDRWSTAGLGGWGDPDHRGPERHAVYSFVPNGVIEHRDTGDEA